MLKQRDFKPLDKEEQELSEYLNKGEYVSLSENEKEEILQQTKEASSNFFKKDKQINIRMSSYDLELIRLIASREGLPYQTYIASQLHKLAEGRLTEKDT